MFGLVIRIWKDLGPIYFWSHGQSTSLKVNKAKVVGHYSNIQLGKVIHTRLLDMSLKSWIKIRSPDS
jgi:hypothetical protein